MISNRSMTLFHLVTSFMWFHLTKSNVRNGNPILIWSQWLDILMGRRLWRFQSPCFQRDIQSSSSMFREVWWDRAWQTWIGGIHQWIVHGILREPDSSSTDTVIQERHGNCRGECIETDIQSGLPRPGIRRVCNGSKGYKYKIRTWRWNVTRPGVY